MSLLVEIYYTPELTLFCCLLPWQLYTRHLVGHCSVGADHLEIQTTQQFEIFLTKIGIVSAVSHSYEVFFEFVTFSSTISC